MEISTFYRGFSEYYINRTHSYGNKILIAYIISMSIKGLRLNCVMRLIGDRDARIIYIYK